MTGIVLVDKPSGWTSHDVVAKLRGILRERKIGHAGTLDPMATGLLTVFIGRATRAVIYAEAYDKRYLAKLRLGLVTDTRDIMGNTISRSDAFITREELESVLISFRGEIMQVPPMYSAIKVGGKKLYELARAGIDAKLMPRAVRIDELKLIGSEDGDWLLDISCSKGTYIRSLCHDIGEALGCGGTLAGLRRTAAGLFSVEDAFTIDKIAELTASGEIESFLLPIDSLFAAYPKFCVDLTQEKLLRNGSRFRCAVNDGFYRVYNANGDFLMLGESIDGQMKTSRSFFEV